MFISNSLHAGLYWPFQGGASFEDPICYICCMLVFIMPSYLFLATLWSPADMGWPLVCGVFLLLVFLLLLSHVVSQVQCGDWLYQFPIFAFFFTLNNKLFL